MKYRKLGRYGPLVSAVSMGRGSQPIKFGDPLEREFNATIRRAYELGTNFFDSSDAYWGTRHEVLLGRAVKGFRDKVLISSKFGNIDLPDGKKALNGRPEYVYRCCDASLERMGVEVIDVYYLHRVDPATPIEETIGAMARLIERGKVRYIGICEAGPEALRRAHETYPVAALQIEYSLWFREVERNIMPVCREFEIGYVAYARSGGGSSPERSRRWMRDPWVKHKIIAIAYLKAWSGMLGLAGGPVRPPLPQITDQEREAMRADLERTGLLARVPMPGRAQAA